ncbi:hypothetical protein NM897_05405 [Planococcus maritimus]|uniref:hypothetical protein n=1 Tax=Planococcus maritimus TaxID=192421 RepID=UPI0031390230
MENSLLMRTDAPFSLNFLIYIQNIFLNKKLSDEELKFPYIFTEVNFEEDFELRYRTLWNEVAQRISEDTSNDLKIFYEEKDLFYHSLFIESAENSKDFNAIYLSFKIWWNSIAGRFSIERSIDERGEKLYVEVANALVQKRIKPQKELTISLIYDESLLADSEVSPYFVVVSLKDIFVDFKEIVSKLQVSIK